MHDIRWKQRFENFEKAFVLFQGSLDDPRFKSFSVLERQGVIQQFEIVVELAWKTLKDYLESGGVEIIPLFPKNVFREAFAAGVFQENEAWAQMIDLRNTLSHAYDQKILNGALIDFQKTFKAPLEKLYSFLKTESQK